jgi:hypothetical protein
MLVKAAKEVGLQKGGAELKTFTAGDSFIVLNTRQY